MWLINEAGRVDYAGPRMRRALLTLSLIPLLAGMVLVGAGAESLEIFFIDVEGGQATLIVTPAGNRS